MDAQPLGIFLLAIYAFITSVVAGVTGVAGGVMLLSLMTFSVPLHIIVPIHGIVQLCSNGFRVYALRKDVHRPTIKAFAAGSIICCYASYFLVQETENRDWFLFIVCLLIFYTIFKPKRMPDIKLNLLGFFILGATIATIGPLVGTIGPFLAPFFIRDDFDRKTMVATKALAQAIIHCLKIPVFLSLSFPYQDYLPHILYMILGAYIGTWVGVSILDRIEHKPFMILVKISLLLIAVRLLHRLYVG